MRKFGGWARGINMCTFLQGLELSLHMYHQTFALFSQHFYRSCETVPGALKGWHGQLPAAQFTCGCWVGSSENRGKGGGCWGLVRQVLGRKHPSSITSGTVPVQGDDLNEVKKNLPRENMHNKVLRW